MGTRFTLITLLLALTLSAEDFGVRLVLGLTDKQIQAGMAP